MKKLVLFGAVIVMASCSKDRTCTCTYTNSANSNSTTQTFTLVESTKGQARANCLTTKQTDTNGTTWTTTCELK